MEWKFYGWGEYFTIKFSLGGCSYYVGVDYISRGITSPMPDHKGFKLQQMSEIHPLPFRNSAL